MEGKKEVKISLNKLLLIILVVLILLLGVFFIISRVVVFNMSNVTNQEVSNKNINIIQNDSNENINITKENSESYVLSNISNYHYGYYYTSSDVIEDYTGEYDLQFISSDYKMDYDTKEKYEGKKLYTYDEYVEYCNEFNINQKYTDNQKKYIVIFSYRISDSYNAKLVDVCVDGDDLTLYIWEEEVDEIENSGFVIAIPIDGQEINNINVKKTYKSSKSSLQLPLNDVPSDEKPIIYLYPTQETEVSVKLLYKDKVTCSYPEYENEWKVLAEPNGDLKYLLTGRKLYSLYYESINTIDFSVTKEGFVVESEKTAEFLEEKLEILGLTEREAEEFIVYWLPKLESNKYNYIRFATIEEINENMPIEITPMPDTTIRILMTYKGLENPIEVSEQRLVKVERNGFVAVEWGGTEIK